MMCQLMMMMTLHNHKMILQRSFAALVNLYSVVERVTQFSKQVRALQGQSLSWVRYCLHLFIQLHNFNKIRLLLYHSHIELRLRLN